ncbi:MAG: DUF503 domain-containing protein [Candidatus Tectomicrobia bacterium]|nr:DUF503 domain-containing protein [Candidatus Tectomicrobia bacterium]
MATMGLLTVDLQIHDSASLKAKRRVVQSITARLRQRFNVSVAELDYKDKWQICRIGVGAVANDLAVIADFTIEIL